MKKQSYTFKMTFKNAQRKDKVCRLLDSEKMPFTDINEEEIRFNSGEHELGRYMQKFEQACGDPDYLMDLDAIWYFRTANEIRLSGMSTH